MIAWESQVSVGALGLASFIPRLLAFSFVYVAFFILISLHDNRNN